MSFDGTWIGSSCPGPPGGAGSLPSGSSLGSSLSLFVTEAEAGTSFSESA